MNDLSPKERLLRSLTKQTVDRPPVICPGGMMNSAIVEIMEKTNHRLPEGHLDAEIMTALAKDIQTHSGFENYGIPFCLTIEAEVLGSTIDYGSLECEPKIGKEAYDSVSKVDLKPLGVMERNQRVRAVAETISTLSKSDRDVPVVGSLTGPISTAASLVDPPAFFKDLYRRAADAHRVVDYAAGQVLDFARIMVESGVDIITIADPTATGEILGPKLFEKYAVPYLYKVIDGIHDLGIPVVLHICGKIEAVTGLLPTLRADALSTDSMVNLEKLKTQYPGLVTMGNLSTILLQFGETVKVERHTERLLRKNIDIIAPACGLSTTTPLDNIAAMTGVVRGN